MKYKGLTVPIEIFYSLIWSLLNIIAAGTLIQYVGSYAPLGLVVFLGFQLWILYIVDVFFTLMAFKESEENDRNRQFTWGDLPYLLRINMCGETS